MVRSIPVMRNAPLLAKGVSLLCRGTPLAHQTRLSHLGGPPPLPGGPPSEGGSTRKMTYPPNDLFARFGTTPPSSKAHDRPDFHRGLDFARRFARKGREIADRLRRLGRCEGRRAERGLGASGKPGADVTPPPPPPPPPQPHLRRPPHSAR